MAATEAADLFSPDKRRERVVDWQAPGPAAKAAARLIDFRLRVAEPAGS
jgi:hypothetical protein